MKWPKWSIVAPIPGDFLPALIGCVFMFISLPGFIMLLVNADRGSAGLAGLLLVVLGAGIVLGAGFIVLGIRVCACPGSLAYRLTHGPIFRHR